MWDTNEMSPKNSKSRYNILEENPKVAA